MEQLRRTAARLGKAQSHVVREAVMEYAARTDRLSERERLHLLGVLERLGHAPVHRTARVVDQEIKAVRAARLANAVLEETGNLSALHIVGQVRLLAVDLLRATGMERGKAQAAVRTATPEAQVALDPDAG